MSMRHFKFDGRHSAMQRRLVPYPREVLVMRQEMKNAPTGALRIFVFADQLAAVCKLKLRGWLLQLGADSYKWDYKL